MVVCVDTIIAQIDPELAVAENRVAKKGVVNGQGARDTDAIAGVSAGAIERDDIGGAGSWAARRRPPDRPARQAAIDGPTPTHLSHPPPPPHTPPPHLLPSPTSL